MVNVFFKMIFGLIYFKNVSITHASNLEFKETFTFDFFLKRRIKLDGIVLCMNLQNQIYLFNTYDLW